MKLNFFILLILLTSCAGMDDKKTEIGFQNTISPFLNAAVLSVIHARSCLETQIRPHVLYSNHVDGDIVMLLKGKKDDFELKEFKIIPVKYGVAGHDRICFFCTKVIPGKINGKFIYKNQLLMKKDAHTGRTVSISGDAKFDWEWFTDKYNGNIYELKVKNLTMNNVKVEMRQVDGEFKFGPMNFEIHKIIGRREK
ncbi:MAG: hypothetical protein KAQ98_08665 [Bacteriovoracaceae bacterium]|nr:hypothetical protein [Bacteriovoracaceae bacterium]